MVEVTTNLREFLAAALAERFDYHDLPTDPAVVADAALAALGLDDQDAKAPKAKIVCPECGHNLRDVFASLIRQRGRFKAQREDARREARQWKANHDSVVGKKRVAEQFRDVYREALKRIVRCDEHVDFAGADLLREIARDALKGAHSATDKAER